ncbi:MAG: hypothetical protein C4306_05090 [Thermoleophilia bacterium]
MSALSCPSRVAAILLAAGVVLLGVELGLGALDAGDARLADPCTSRPAFAGSGIDGAIQRFGLSALAGAACELGTSREELVLSFVPAAGEEPVRWDRETIERALRPALERAARDTAGEGVVGDLLSFLLRVAVARPIEFFLGLAA